MALLSWSFWDMRATCCSLSWKVLTFLRKKSTLCSHQTIRSSIVGSNPSSFSLSVHCDYISTLVSWLKSFFCNFDRISCRNSSYFLCTSRTCCDVYSYSTKTASLFSNTSRSKVFWFSFWCWASFKLAFESYCVLSALLGWLNLTLFDFWPIFWVKPLRSKFVYPLFSRLVTGCTSGGAQ